MYEVVFLDGEIRPYAVNVIADNIWAQVDPDRQRYVIFELIIDHHVDNSIAMSKETCIASQMVKELCKDQHQMSSFYVY